MQDPDKIWNHFKGLRSVQKYNDRDRYCLRMGTFTAQLKDEIDFDSDIVIDENSLNFKNKITEGELEDLLPEWLADHTDRIKNLHIKLKSYERLKLVLMYIDRRFDYPVNIYFDEFANWELKGSKREFVDHNIKALFEWAEQNSTNLEIIQRNHRQSAVITISKQ